MSKRGEVAIVLHAHMPYVEGYGTWPFGEEWLWEAIVHSYLPLASLFTHDPPLTLSLTPVLLDQLLAEGVPSRFKRFVEEVRARTVAEDSKALAQRGQGAAAAELERAYSDEYLPAGHRLGRQFAPLLEALLSQATLTSAATHAVLPLLATPALVRLQVRLGVESFCARRRKGWEGGFWLPECGHSPALEPVLAAEGVRYFCVEWTNRFGRGAPENLHPRTVCGGVVAVPIDREGIDLVWGPRGFPAHPAYRSTHRRSPQGHCAWANDGSPYNPRRAQAIVRAQAGEYAAYLARRAGAGALLVLAFDAELFGLWWYEGVWFLEALLEALAEGPTTVVKLGEAAAILAAAEEKRRAPPSSWGSGGDLSTWSSACAEVRAMAARARRLECAALRAGGALSAPALRHLLAVQASDWTYMVAHNTAAPYGRGRFAEHCRAVEAALAGEPVCAPRNLAPAARAVALSPRANV